jgi:hypothetical protein
MRHAGQAAAPTQFVSLASAITYTLQPAASESAATLIPV